MFRLCFEHAAHSHTSLCAHACIHESLAQVEETETETETETVTGAARCDECTCLHGKRDGEYTDSESKNQQRQTEVLCITAD